MIGAVGSTPAAFRAAGTSTASLDMVRSSTRASRDAELIWNSASGTVRAISAAGASQAFWRSQSRLRTSQATNASPPKTAATISPTSSGPDCVLEGAPQGRDRKQDARRDEGQRSRNEQRRQRSAPDVAGQLAALPEGRDDGQHSDDHDGAAGTSSTSTKSCQKAAPTLASICGTPWPRKPSRWAGPGTRRSARCASGRRCRRSGRGTGCRRRRDCAATTERQPARQRQRPPRLSGRRRASDRQRPCGRRQRKAGERQAQPDGLHAGQVGQAEQDAEADQRAALARGCGRHQQARGDGQHGEGQRMNRARPSKAGRGR